MLIQLSAKNELVLPEQLVKAIGASRHFRLEMRGAQILLTPVPAQDIQTLQNEPADLDIEDTAAWARKNMKSIEEEQD